LILNNFRYNEGGGANIPRCLQAVRQLLSVITEFLLFRFKGFKHLIYYLFCPEIELSDSLLAAGCASATLIVKNLAILQNQ